MSTLVVTNDFPPRTGGIESFVHAVVRRLPAQSEGDAARVVVHTARQRGDAEVDAVLDREGITVVRDPSPLVVPTPAITRRVQRTAREHGADRVWFGAAAPLGLMAGALRQAGVGQAGVGRTVATTHGHEVWWSTLPGSREALRRIGERNDTVTYLGDWCRSRIERPLTGAARARMRRLTPGVDVGTFRPDPDARARVREEFGLGGRPVVVCVSRIVARKGQDVLVRALPRIRRRIPDAALLVVGDGPHRAAVERLAERTGVSADVVFTGAVPWARAPEFYAAGDVFCMPTRTRLGGLEPEALGICYLEAAACGLPVVAGDSGGAPDAVLDGVNGRVVPGRDVDRVAQVLGDLLLDRETAARFAAAGREWVTRSWGWEEQTRRLANLLSGTDVRPDPGLEH